MAKRIRISYDVVTEESAAQGDVAESGWEDEEGVSVENVKEAVEFLNDEGAEHASSSQFHPGVWYSTEAEQDYQTGEWTTHYFHLSGFSPKEQEAIFRAVTEGLEPGYEIATWFERDRAHVELKDTLTGDTVIEWWDEDVQAAVDDGFLDPSDWEGSAIEYAEHLGVI